jgi:hypothetical protein
MYWEDFIVMTNTDMSSQSGLGETLKSYAFYIELTTKEWETSLTYSSVDGFDNNMEAMIHYGNITLERLEHYEEYEKCKRLNRILKLYEPIIRKKSN